MNRKQLYEKKIQSLKSTQKYFNETKSLSPVELKEFSLLYLTINNLNFFQENIQLIENIRFFTNENKLIFNDILSQIKSIEKPSLENLEIDKQILDKISKFAPIKHILNNNKNNQQKIFELVEEISRDLKNYDLEFRIEQLESKFSRDLSENTFNELIELKKQKNIN